MNDVISDYLSKLKYELPNVYNWQFDTEKAHSLFGKSIDGNNWFEKTKNLRRVIESSLESNKETDFKQSVAEYFIKDWGQIKRFGKTTDVVHRFSEFEGSAEIPYALQTPFQSVSSWSKWASIVCPRWACIYDARVAYSINAINFITGAHHRIFPEPEGRNSRLKMFDVSTLLLAQKIQQGDSQDPKALRSKYFIPKSSVYTAYLSLVASVSENIWGDRDHIHEVEMLLFALADTHVYTDVVRQLKSVS